MKEFSEKIVDSISDVLLVIDPNDYTIIGANEVVLKQLKLRKEDLIGKTCYEATHNSPTPCKPPHHICPIQVMLKTGKAVTVEHTHFDRDNNEVYVEVSAYPVRDRGGKVIQVVHFARDITDRKKAEKALKESEQKLRDIIDTSPDAIVWVDTTGKITLVNRKGFEITGFSEKDFIGVNFLDVEALTQESKEKILESFMKRIEGIDTPPYEVEVVTKNGEIVPAEISASPILEGGKIVGTQSIFRDLRERKAMEEVLRKSEEKFRNIFEIANDCMVYLDSSGRILDVNKKTVQLFGGSKEELLGKNFTTLGIFSLGDLPALESIFANILAGGEDTIDLCIKNKKGQEMHLECSASLMKADDEIAGMMVIARDVTERKVMEKKLHEYAEHLEEMVEHRTKELVDSEKRYRVLYETIRDGISTTDMNGRIIDCNQAYADILGYSKDELKNFTYQQLTPKQWHQVEAKLIKEQVVKRGYSDEYEKEYIRKDGTVFPISIKVGLIRGEDGKPEGMWGIVRDITERKQMEAQLLKTERLATIGELATMVGHDLRNPLSSLQNACYYLKMKLGASKDEKVKKMFEVIDNEINYANNIVKDLLDFSRIKKPELKKVDIISSIQEAITQLKFPENITLTKKFSEVPTIEADPDQLRRVFQNIALNGIQAMPYGGELTVSARKKGDFVEAAFTDTGVGIPEENRSELFAPLFTTKAQGVGLGLAICKNLLEGHNGRIEVKSKVGEGSTFTVKLPVHQTKGGEKQT